MEDRVAAGFGVTLVERQRAFEAARRQTQLGLEFGRCFSDCGQFARILRLFEDLVVEYQITRPGPARDALAALITPLTAQADLLETLRVHMSCGMNRRETARRLEVHPNTVDNRMSRVAATIGLDLSQPRAITQARSAILAWDAVTAGT